jgi:hypothetical protein
MEVHCGYLQFGSAGAYGEVMNAGLSSLFQKCLISEMGLRTGITRLNHLQDLWIV